jgi:hypothetical protein
MAEETMVMAAAVSVTVKAVAVAVKAVDASTVVKKGKFMSSS